MGRVKSKSEAFKHGEPESHKQALNNLIAFWKKHSTHPYSYNYFLKYDIRFIKKQKLTSGNRTSDGHEYDFVAFTNKVIEDHQILMEYGFIEIDGEKHDKKNQKINDGIAEDFIHDLLPNAFFIRLKKSELLGEDANVYMAKELSNVL